MTMTYRHREGPVADVDVWNLLATEGSLTAPGPLIVPPKMNRITQIIWAVGDSAATAAIRANNFILKLTGVDAGEVLIPLGSVGGLVVGAAGNSSTRTGAIVRDVDIAVTPGKQLNPYVCYAGTDTSAPEASVTFGFSTS